MPKLAEEVSALTVARITKPGLNFVGVVQGLALHVTRTGARSWLLRAMVGGRRREMGLGNYPEVTLARAREKARDARDLIRQGVDPIAQQRTAQSAMRAAVMAALTFRQTADAYMQAHESSWKSAKHGQQWRNTLEQHAYPVLGDLLVRDVNKEHVLQVLRPIWLTTNETAVRLRGRIELVLSYAMQAGYRPEGLNPARWKDGLDTLLARPSKVNNREHHAALPIDAMGAFMVKLREAGGMGARALELVILTAARSGEVRGATWAEINIDAKVWSVPASRMKAGKEHRVPLSEPALALLAALPRMAGTELVFPAARGGMLSDMTLSAVLRRMDVPAVPHGFRSTFRDWVSERTTYPNEMAEMALAHSVSDKVEAAYRRGDMLARRSTMMADWAQFLARVESKGKVIDLQSKRA